MLKRSELEKSLKSLGIRKGDIVLLHSSAVSLGEVEGGPEAILDAFLAVLGPKGTLAVPAFGRLGILTDLVKAHKDVVTSNAPVGTIAAIGGRAKELLAGHLQAETAHGHGSPYEKIAEAGGKICLLGVDLDRNTMLHSVEALLQLPYLGQTTTTSKDDNGKEVTRTWKYYPGPHRNFIGLDAVLREAEVMKVARIGDAQVRLIDAKDMMETLLELGKDDPAFALCANPSCAACVRQRADIDRARFAKESFRLAAAASLCGRYVPEMNEKLKAAGIALVELDYIQGQAAAYMPAAKLAAAVREFADAGIEISGLRVAALPVDVETKLADWTTAGIQRVILPLSAANATVEKLFKKAKIQLDYVNAGMNSTDVKARLEAATGTRKSARAFVFNPVEFVLAGENPFLRSWKLGHFIRTISQLDLTDATWTGEATELAQGNAEVWELLSILRCGNFSGYVTLGGGHPYPGDLAEAAEQLLEALA